MYQTGYVLLILAGSFCFLALVQFKRHPLTGLTIPLDVRGKNPYEQIDGVKTLHGFTLVQESARQEKLREGNFSRELIDLCTESPKFFHPDQQRPIVALSSFPGSGNTWARHLLHMASGYWTGNRRGSNHLKQYGWAGEDVDCMDRTTIAQKTHRLHHNKACNFERGIVIIRNPFDAILAAFNHHKAGKTGEPDYSVYQGPDWNKFVSKWTNRWSYFHHEWINFKGPVKMSCFHAMRNNLKSEIGQWLDFLDLDRSRLDCVDFDPVGQFYRHKTKDYSHIYTPPQRKRIMAAIKRVSSMLKSNAYADCTKHFDYNSCCNNGTLPF